MLNDNFICLIEISLFEKILSLLLGLVTKLDGMVRTMVVTIETCEAVVMMQPYRHFPFTAINISNRTDMGADATFHTFVCCDVKTLVCNENFFKETTHNLGEKPWNRTFYQSADTFLTIENLLADFCQFQSRLLLFPNLLFLRIDIHER